MEVPEPPIAISLTILASLVVTLITLALPGLAVIVPNNSCWACG